MTEDPKVEAARLAASGRANAACAATAARLHAAGTPTEALAEYVPARRKLLVMRAATMRPLGEVWRIGSLLLGTDARLYALGHATRAAERGRPGYQSVSREERREIAAAALRGGYEIGRPVNFDTAPIELHAEALSGFDPASRDGRAAEAASLPSAIRSDSPVGYANGEVRVRWRPGASLDSAPTLAAFLEERATLLIAPPFAG